MKPKPNKSPFSPTRQGTRRSIPHSPPRMASVLYAAVSHGPTILTDLLSSGDNPDLSSIASRCLANAPPHHLHYTHTSQNRIEAFVMADPFIFFAIADEAHGRSELLQLLSRLSDALSFSPALRKIKATGPSAPYCLQNELLPVLRRVMLPSLCHPQSHAAPSPSHDDSKASASVPHCIWPMPSPSREESSGQENKDKDKDKDKDKEKDKDRDKEKEKDKVEMKKNKKKEKEKEKQKKKKECYHHNVMSINIITF
ncbi:SNARE-like protein [Dioscorea alata]|uniref:SNARE-like protein n=1 Tax=Dioscorea alata TaxID=55571 RepID=A0ACB7UCM0_DIOAL|nr:SNARE-like protein [Dioscorea alata]